MSLLVIGIALVLILEGILPTLAPKLWLHSLKTASRIAPEKARLLGLVALLAGVTLLFFFTPYTQD